MSILFITITLILIFVLQMLMNVVLVNWLILSIIYGRLWAQGIIDMNRNGNSANVCNDKKSKELFASFLNGILISVRCVSSIKFVFNA